MDIKRIKARPTIYSNTTRPLITKQSLKIVVEKYLYVTLCAICYYLQNLKSVKNTHGGVLLLVTFLASVATLRSFTHPWVFCSFLNHTNRAKLYQASHMIKCHYVTLGKSHKNVLTNVVLGKT